MRAYQARNCCQSTAMGNLTVSRPRPQTTPLFVLAPRAHATNRFKLDRGHVGAPGQGGGDVGGSKVGAGSDASKAERALLIEMTMFCEFLFTPSNGYDRVASSMYHPRQPHPYRVDTSRKSYWLFRLFALPTR